MTKRDILNLRKVAIDTLKLINLNKKEFLEKLGRKTLEELIDQKLDLIIYCDKLLKKLEEDEDR